MRETILGTWPLAPAGHELDPLVQDRLTEAMLRDLRLLNPCIKNLKASSIQSRIAAIPSGLVLSAWLVETPQLEFELRTKSGKPVTDLYSIDADTLKESIKATGGHINTALNPHITSADIRDLISVNPLLGHLRRRSRSKQTRTPVVNAVGLHSTVTSFSLGLVRKIEASVVAMLPQQCLLQDVGILTPSEDDLTLVFPKKIPMSRPSSIEDRQFVWDLLSCLETGRKISVDVLVLLDWATGQPKSIEFRGLSSNAE